MHKYELLRQRAGEFLCVLEEYAKKDREVEWLLERYRPWYERIQRREIRLPCYEFKLGIYFANPDVSPLADRYGIGALPNPLRRVWVLFEEAMRDELSSQIHLDWLKSHGETPSAILDELPPPEEEAPLPESAMPAQTKGIKGLFQRLFTPDTKQ